MTILTTLALVLLILAAVVGSALAVATVVRGDGHIGPGRSPAPPRSHPADVFESAMRRLT